MFYKGWRQDQYIDNVLAFAPSGMVIAWLINALESIQESLIAEKGKLFMKLKKAHNKMREEVIVDSEFSREDYLF